MDPTIEIIERYGLQRITARELDAQEEKKGHFFAVMLKIGQPVEDTGCLICISDGLKALKRYYRIEMAKQTAEKRAKKVKPKYRLKDGLQAVYDGIQYSNNTLTDEIAIKMLEQVPDKIAFFKVFPEEWNNG